MNTNYSGPCYTAKIRKCEGIIVEVVASQPERAELFNLLEYFKKNSEEYFVYPLRHSENDWSRPVTVADGPLFVNRFGWFITRKKMKFSRSKKDINVWYPEVNLNSRNCNIDFSDDVNVNDFINNKI